MNIMNCRHIYFVPNKLLSNPTEDDNLIFVFSSRVNGKVYKRKRNELGIIYYHKKGKWSLLPKENNSLTCETLMIISQFLTRLNNGSLKYNGKKGEIYE